MNALVTRLKKRGRISTPKSLGSSTAADGGAVTAKHWSVEKAVTRVTAAGTAPGYPSVWINRPGQPAEALDIAPAAEGSDLSVLSDFIKLRLAHWRLARLSRSI